MGIGTDGLGFADSCQWEPTHLLEGGHRAVQSAGKRGGASDVASGYVRTKVTETVGHINRGVEMLPSVFAVPSPGLLIIGEVVVL